MASRTFQPDPLMIMLILLGWFLLVRYDDRPTLPRLLGAAIVTGLAVLVKVMALFFLVPVFLALALARYTPARRRFRRLLSDPHAYLFVGISLLPVFTYYWYGLFIAKTLVGASKTGFAPGIIVTLSFWMGWLTMIGNVVGALVVLLSLFGLFLAPDTRTRWMLIALWIGYVVYGLVFSYGIATHHYYQLPLMAITAVGLAPLFAAAIPLLAGRTSRLRPAVLAVFWCAIAVSIFFTGIRQFHPDYQGTVAMDRQIGELLGHTSRAIMLTDDYGTGLRYYGEMAGTLWPTTLDFSANEWKGGREGSYRGPTDARAPRGGLLRRHPGSGADAAAGLVDPAYLPLPHPLPDRSLRYLQSACVTGVTHAPAIRPV